MSLKNIKNRIKKIQANVQAVESLDLVARAIERGAFYDELTDEEKNAYCAYQDFERQSLEEVHRVVLGTLHFQVSRKEKPLTEAQFRERVKEIEAFGNEMMAEYNTPEAMAKREAEYQELQRIGALRKAAFERGEPMSNYPLPWEKKDKT